MAPSTPHLETHSGAVCALPMVEALLFLLPLLTFVVGPLEGNASEYNY